MSHQAEVIEVREAGDGVLAVRVRCCGDPSTDSVHTLHQLERDDAVLDQEIADNVARVETLHQARDHAKRHIERLVRK